MIQSVGQGVVTPPSEGLEMGRPAGGDVGAASVAGPGIDLTARDGGGTDSGEPQIFEIDSRNRGTH